MRIEYRYTTLCCLALLIGLLMSLYWHGLITISFGRPAHYVAMHDISTKSVSKKQGNLFFWQNNKWNHEAIEYLASDIISDTVAHLANKWLALLEEERLMKKRVTVQQVLLHATGSELSISFDRYPFNKESSCYEKWLWIEGLLKTLRENEIAIQHVNFKVRHELLRDYHLDFSSPWPLQGFLVA